MDLLRKVENAASSVTITPELFDIFRFVLGFEHRGFVINIASVEALCGRVKRTGHNSPGLPHAMDFIAYEILSFVCKSLCRSPEEAGEMVLIDQLEANIVLTRSSLLDLVKFTRILNPVRGLNII